MSTQALNKDDFRSYLEKTGAIDQITRMLISLSEATEKPADSISYMKKFLGSPTENEVEEYKKELELLRNENKNLQKRIRELESQRS
mmetsp:Transcript_71683/g.83355  ORF Transcript_71683/g.83355 Transcript_71683/m.83355 type:complete len:87 (-) Transcript_71683:132-392(-)